MRKKYKEYKLEPTLEKLPQEVKEDPQILTFRPRDHSDVTMRLTARGYAAIMKRDGDYFNRIWERIDEDGREE